MLGVLGGMGPLATIDFMEKVVRNTPARCDQDHVEMIVCSAAKIPDRTAAIMGGGPDPFPAMLDALRRLERAGARAIAIPCNTAHHWHARLQAETPVPILHIVDAAADMLESIGMKQGSVGLLATDGTVAARIYQDRLRPRGFQCLTPDPEGQRDVMKGIRLVKAGRLKEAETILRRQAEHLLADGAAHVAMACTDIPVALNDADGDLEGRLFDPTEALARACLRLFSSGGEARDASHHGQARPT